LLASSAEIRFQATILPFLMTPIRVPPAFSQRHSSRAPSSSVSFSR
jgi:hypothetical protein